MRIFPYIKSEAILNYFIYLIYLIMLSYLILTVAVNHSETRTVKDTWS